MNVDQLRHPGMLAHRRLHRGPGIFIGIIPVVIRNLSGIIIFGVQGANAPFFQPPGNIRAYQHHILVGVGGARIVALQAQQRIIGFPRVGMVDHDPLVLSLLILLIGLIRIAVGCRSRWLGRRALCGRACRCAFAIIPACAVSLAAAAGLRLRRRLRLGRFSRGSILSGMVVGRGSGHSAGAASQQHGVIRRHAGQLARQKTLRIARVHTRQKLKDEARYLLARESGRLLRFGQMRNLHPEQVLEETGGQGCRQSFHGRQRRVVQLLTRHSSGTQQQKEYEGPAGKQQHCSAER
ncbi:hypothetical protein D3C75_539000 [compost metagenome]